MNRMSRVVLAFAATTMGVAPAYAWDPLGDINRAAINIGKTIEKGANDAGRAVEKGAHDTGNAIEKGAHDTGHSLEKATSDAGHAIEKGTHDTGHALEKATQDTGRALEKATHDTGHAVEGAGQFIKDHPWETVIAVALIAGGGYLIVYEGFTLSLTVEGVHVVEVSCLATCGTAVGTGLTVVGAGTEALAFYVAAPRRNIDSSAQRTYSPGSASDSDGPPSAAQRTAETGTSTTSSGQFTMTYRPDVAPQDDAHRSPVFQQANRPRVVVGGSPNPANSGPQPAPSNNTTRAVEAVVVTHYSPSIMFEPRLAKNPNDMQRYSYASWVAGWAAKTLPIDQFDPDSPNTISDVELKILDAITTLQGIEASDNEKAEEQRRERMNPLPSVMLDQAIETNKEIWWSIVKGEDAREAFTLAKQLEMFRGANALSASGALKWLTMTGAPEVAGGLSFLGLMNTGTAFGVLMSSTATSEGLRQSSDELAAQLWSQLDGYNRKREKKFGKPPVPPMRTVESVPQGPVLQRAP